MVDATSQAVNRKRFSVIIPLVEHRGMGLQALPAWQHGQTFPREHFEILVVSPGQEIRIQQEATTLLKFPDRVLIEQDANRSRLYDLGARNSCGEFVFFTESHVLPRPDFLSRLDESLQTHSVVGACCGSVGVTRTFKDRLDQKMFEEGFNDFAQEGDWRKFNVHGFALRREVYEQVGGLTHRYSGFAEMMLAAALRDRGLRLGYASNAVVEHHYRATFADNSELIDFFLLGESLYRREHPGQDTVGYTFLPAGLETLPSGHAPANWTLASAMLRACLAWRFWRKKPILWPALAKILWQCLRPSGWLGSWGDRLEAACAEWVARVRYEWWRWNPTRREAAYRDCFLQASRRSRVAFLARHPEQREPAPFTGSAGILDFAATDLTGFHDVEQWQGRSFRWTERSALLRLHGVTASPELFLETNNLRPDLQLSELRVFVNGRLLAANAVRLENLGIRVRLPGGTLRTLGLVCRPLQPWKHGVQDERELGLPIFSVSLGGQALALVA